MSDKQTTPLPTSIWQLPELLKPMHRYRHKKIQGAKDRSHFPAILAFCHANRFTTAGQIQRRFSEHLRSARTARRHLLEMQSLRLLDVVETLGVSAYWPKVFYVTGRGVRRLQKAYAERGKEWQPRMKDRGRNEGMTVRHVLHELFITECLLSTWEATQQRDDLELLKRERRSLQRHPAFRVSFQGKKSRLIPDAMTLHRQAGKGMMCSFFEIDAGSMGQANLEAKFRRYRVWSESPNGREFLLNLYRQHGAKNPRPAFRILMVIASGDAKQCQRRAELVKRIVDKHGDALKERLWLCTVDDIVNEGEEAAALDRIQWRRMDGSTGMTRSSDKWRKC